MDEITLEECMIRHRLRRYLHQGYRIHHEPREPSRTMAPTASTPILWASMPTPMLPPVPIPAWSMPTTPTSTYKMGTMVNETVIAQTFNKDLAS